MWNLNSTSKFLREVDQNKRYLEHRRCLSALKANQQVTQQPLKFQHLSKFNNKYDKWRKNEVTVDNGKIHKTIKTLLTHKGSLNKDRLQNSLFKVSSINRLPQKVFRNRSINNENLVSQKVITQKNTQCKIFVQQQKMG